MTKLYRILGKRGRITIPYEIRKRVMEDEDNEVIESLRALDEIMADYAPTRDFDEDLFGQIVESITVVSKNMLRFCLAGGLALTERI